MTSSEVHQNMFDLAWDPCVMKPGAFTLPMNQSAEFAFRAEFALPILRLAHGMQPRPSGKGVGDALKHPLDHFVLHRGQASL